MFTLFHTNDFHNHLSVAQASRLRHLRDSARDSSLLLDAGDAVGSGNITFRPGGEPILDLMHEAGYDAMTVGNREFHFSRFGFEMKLSRAKFPVLCANVRLSSQSYVEKADALAGIASPNPEYSPANDAVKSALPVVPYFFHESSDGWRIVVFGLTVPMITERMLSRKVSAYIFDDPISTANTLVPRLRADFQPDLLVALTHIGHQRDRKLAEAVPDIDLIIGGHSHTSLGQGERVGETLIVQTGCFGHNLGIIEASKRPGERPSLTARLETL